MRSYGHNYLDKTTFLQITLHDSTSSNRNAPVEWYLDESLFSSSKLTISLKSTKSRHISELIPYTVSLPILDDSESVTFQVDSLDNLCLELEVYPTFGSKVIAKGVAPPSLFESTRRFCSGKGVCIIPLLDPRLQTIGQVSFDFTVIKPFVGVQFDIHSRIETYWKSTQAIAGPKSKTQAQIQQHLVTESSLSGQYIWVPIQVTKDNVAYVCPTWRLPTPLLHLAVHEVSAKELENICATARSRESVIQQCQSVQDVHDVQDIISNSYIPLAELLSLLNPDIHLHLQILLPTIAEQRYLGVNIGTDVNSFIDTILANVFSHVDELKSRTVVTTARSIIFSSSNPTLCTALNWKQPNCKSI